MQLFVKTLNGKTITIDVEPNTSIEIVKKKIKESENISVNEQRLIYQGKDLYFGTLNENSVEQNETIHVVLRILSCKCCHQK